MNNNLETYVEEVVRMYLQLTDEYVFTPELSVALLNFAVNMRNTDNMNTNITANMNITESECDG